MNYKTLFLNQNKIKKHVKLQALNPKHWLILSYLVQNHLEHEEQRKDCDVLYFYDSVKDNLPALGITTWQTAKKYIVELRDSGLLHTKPAHGRYIYIKPTELALEIACL